ncbi:hypothetical protein Acife_1950 [Acidithiobacillus ferrivorans SS3]|uniref:Uncharacterized protein n=1 Tax=Acidithiobacillus ferrivorans SS3 TaxID=743299 RepID=G0JLM4_9PROT|nr:SIR2 family protein [Acidithiobacillus ferrivorans]AEM48073.1 hypothetical protein Acife_1950 [Acidithiobacillus ferrivorans SS3]
MQQRERLKPEFHVDHNVYIIGAGYSAAAGLPLLTNFLEKMRCYRITLADADEFAIAIDDVLTYRRDCASASDKIKLDLDNIETLLSLAAASPDVDIKKAIALAIGATINFYQKNYNHSVSLLKAPLVTVKYTDESLRRDFYQYSAAIMSGDEGGLAQRDRMANTIISFNYDTMIEDALAGRGLCFTYGFDALPPDSHCIMQGDSLPERACHLLKLHGSINWSEEGSHEVGVVGKKYLYSSFDDLIENSSDRTPLIIPPWWKKDPVGIFNGIWGKAIDRLRTATRIIFIGYSCPPTDQYVKYLLAAGLQNNISLVSVHVVDSDPRVQDAVASLFPSASKWVKSSASITAEKFFRFPSTAPEWVGSLTDINRDP